MNFAVCRYVGSYDRDTISQIRVPVFSRRRDFFVDRQPLVIPTLYSRRVKLYLQDLAASRMLRELGSGVPTCVSVTPVDGIVSGSEALKRIS